MLFVNKLFLSLGMEIKEKELKNGMVFIFQTKDKDDLRELEVSMKRNQFIFWFNGIVIDSCKTFKTTILIVDRLTKKWDLEFNRLENE